MSPLLQTQLMILLLVSTAVLTCGQKPVLVVESSHNDQVSDVKFSPDGKLLVSAGWDGTAKIWSVTSRKLLWTLMGYQAELQALAFSPDNQTLASISGNAVLWDVQTGNVKRVIDGGPWSAVAFSMDGAKLALTSDKVITIFDVASGVQLFSLPGHKDEITAIAFSPTDKDLLLSATKTGEIFLWNISTRKVTHALDAKSYVEVVAFSPAGDLYAFGTENDIKINRASTNETINEIRQSSAKDIAFAPDGKTLLSGDASGKIILRNVQTGKILRVFKDFSDESLHWVNGVAFHQSGKMIATCDAEGDLKLWDVENGDVLTNFKSGIGAITSLAFNWSDSILAIGSADQSIKLWDLQSGQRLPSMTGHQGWTTEVKFVGDYDLFSTSLDQTLKSWNVGENKLKGSSDLGTYFDGRHAAADFLYSKFAHATDEQIKIFDRVQSSEKSLPTPGFKTQSLAFSNNAKFLCAGGEDGTLKLWNTDDGTVLKSWQAHHDVIYSVAFNVGGKTLASAGIDGFIKVWDVSTGTEIREIRTPVNFWTKLAFAYESSFLASSNYDGSIKIWDLKTGQELVTLVALDKIEKVDFKVKTKSGQPLITLAPENHWVVATPDGRFDTDLALESIEGLHWGFSNDPLAYMPLEIFMRDYYEPKLLPRILKCTQDGNCGKEFKPVRDLRALNRAQPNVEIAQINRVPNTDTVDVTVKVGSATSEHQRDDQNQPLQSGVYDVRLFRDGQIVGYTQPSGAQAGSDRKGSGEAEWEEWRQSNRVKLDTNGKATITFSGIKLPHRADTKQVEFSTYAFNSDRVKSRTDRKSLDLPPDITPVKGRAYIISVGVNAYENSYFNLQFAADDARLVERTVTQRLAATGQFEKVVSISLLSDYKKIGEKMIPTLTQATKSNFNSVLQLLSKRSAEVDRRKLEGIANVEELRPATPDDLVLIMYSSHGYADRDGNFYFIPYDTGPGTGKVFTNTVRQHSISSEELSLWLRDVDAGEMLMIVDACHSTVAVAGQEFKPGPMGSRGLGQLSYDKRMRILTATQADNVAWEYRTLKQGVLTYALVRDGIEARQADFKPKDNIITIAEWLAYGTTRVPKLYQEVQSGSVQTFGLAASEQPKLVVILQDGSLTSGKKELAQVLVGSGKSTTMIQQPSLFDFARRKSDIVLLSLN